LDLELKKQEQSSSVVDPLAYLVKTTHQHAPTYSTTTSPSQLTPAFASTSSSTAQSHNDAMLATMKQIANLLSGFQKQFPPTNNQLRSSSNIGTHAMVHDGQITTESVQRRAPGNTRNMGYQGNQNNGQGVNNKKKDEHLDFDDDSVHEDYTIPYDQYLATKESQDVPTEASPIPPTAAYMLQTLTDSTTQVEGHHKVNQEQALVNATLSA
nr:hypothetical protein [Tanacetum cinerariifolium]